MQLPRAAVALVVGASALALAACSGTGGSAVATSGTGATTTATTATTGPRSVGGTGITGSTTTTRPPTTTTKPPAPTTTTTRPPTTTTKPPPTTRPVPPKGGPVPANFVPVSFTAVSAKEYWLLGTAPCSNPVCTSIVRTTDGGKSFDGEPAPRVPVSTSPTASPGGSIDTLRFADRLDGYAFESGTGNAGDPLWTTHDGGVHWAESPLRPLAFATAHGYAFALTATCTAGSCTHLALQRSPVGEEAWSALPVPLGAVTPGVDMTAHGASVWLTASVPGSAGPHQVLLASADSGQRMRTYTSPCTNALGGTIRAASASTLWAVCPTGTDAAAFRSTDAGAKWTALTTPILANSAQLAPATATTAVLSTGAPGTLLRTTNGGTTFATVVTKGGVPGTWSFIGFTTPRTGSAIVEVTTPKSVPSAQLWRSTDGGVRWHGPVTIGP